MLFLMCIRWFSTYYFVHFFRSHETGCSSPWWHINKQNWHLLHLTSLFSSPLPSLTSVPLLAGWRQSSRSCRTAAGRQTHLSSRHPAGIQPHPGKTMVQPWNFMACVFVLTNGFIPILQCGKLNWKPRESQMSREVINELLQLVSSPDPSFSLETGAFSLSSLFMKPLWVFTAVIASQL